MSYLIKKGYNYSKSGKKRERKLKKYYLTVPALALLQQDNINIRSHCFENLIALYTGADFFWRNPKKDKVDVVVEKDGKLLPIEVKYKNRKEYSGLLKFMKKFNVKRGIVVTRDLEDSEKINSKKIDYIPGWKYLIRCIDDSP